MDKLKYFQVVSHSYLNMISSELATLWRLFVVFSYLLLSIILITVSYHGGDFVVALHDLILQAELKISFSLVVSFLIGCWLIMVNNNLARQILAFFKNCVVVIDRQPVRAAARSTSRCRASLFRFR